MINRLRIFILVVITACLPVSGMLAKESITTQNTVDLNVWFTQLIDTTSLVGISACVVSGDRIVWQGGFGKADIDQDIQVTPNTLFMQASCSKLFTGAALLKLCETGQLDLDEDINRYLPFSVRNPAFPDVAITSRMLLTYTSSIADRQEIVTAL